MAESGKRIVSNVNKVGSEVTGFPLVCENCLGDDPYVRMTKAPAGDACKICERAFTSFRWKAGTKGRFKVTIVCQSCARMKNVCQCCLLDLEFGLPVQIRDKYLAENDSGISVPTSRVGIDYQIQQRALQDQASSSSLAMIENGSAEFSLSKIPELQRIARSAPYYDRNESKVCSFYQQGKCTRGELCPYRHLVNQTLTSAVKSHSIYERFHGMHDSVAQKLDKRISSGLANQPSPPMDVSIKTLFVTNIPKTAVNVDNQLSEQFSNYGSILKLKYVPTGGCAFIEYSSRESAEKAMTGLFNNLMLNDVKLKVSWARPKEEHKITPQEPSHSSNGAYPSMNPLNLGNVPLSD